ncbi:MAG: ABA4-like family protein [Chloroflexota bacterium]
METIFSLSSLLVMPFWALMIFTPRFRWTQRIMKSAWVIAPAALLYFILVVPEFTAVFTEVINPSLDGIAALLGTPSGATVGWVHFLAFDLFVGRWAYLDGLKYDISPFIMAPILFFTLMLGPVGFLLYMGVKTAVGRNKAAVQVSGN